MQPPQCSNSGDATMDQLVPTQVNGALSKTFRRVGLVLAGTALAAILIGWVAFLLWLTAEAVITVVHWL